MRVVYKLKSNSETGVTGKITVNGKNRSSNSENFRNVSAYIHQDDALRPYLTVREAMTMATHLKLGFSVKKEYKVQLVSETLRLKVESIFYIVLRRCLKTNEIIGFL